MRIVTHLTGVVFSRTVRHILCEVLRFLVMTVAADGLHGAFKRIRATGLRSRMARGAIVVCEGCMLVAHHQRRRITRMRIVAGRAALADRVEAYMAFTQFRLISVTRLTERRDVFRQ